MTGIVTDVEAHAVPMAYEAVAVTVESDEPLGTDRILRRLEVVRQSLSIKWCGASGSFAGYDRLDSTGCATVKSGTVTFSARLLEVYPRSHTVELVAVHEHAELGSTVLVHGRGRSIQGIAAQSTAKPAGT